MPDSVGAVSVVSTGVVEIRRQHVKADGSPLLWWLLTARGWSRPRPINVYVIHHEQGLVLFDTGQDRASVTDRSYFPAGIPGFLYRRLARFKIGEKETPGVDAPPHRLAWPFLETAAISGGTRRAARAVQQYP